MLRAGCHRLTLSAFMIGLAVLTVTAWAVGEARVPEYAEGWIHSQIVVVGAMTPPYGNSEAAPDRQEIHVRKALDPGLWREAAPGRTADDLRRRLRVWCDPPDRMFLSIRSRDPADRSVVEAIGSLYIEKHGGHWSHGATPLDAPSYPRRRPMIAGLSIFWAALAALGLAKWTRSRRLRGNQLLALR